MVARWCLKQTRSRCDNFPKYVPQLSGGKGTESSLTGLEKDTTCNGFSTERKFRKFAMKTAEICMLRKTSLPRCRLILVSPEIHRSHDSDFERVVMKNDRLSVDRKEMDKFGGDWHETITCEQSRLDKTF